MLIFPHIPLSFYVLLIIILNTLLFLKLCIYVDVYVVCAAKEARRGCWILWIWSHSGWELPKVGAKNWTLICWKEQEGTLHALNCQAISPAPVIKYLKILFVCISAGGCMRLSMGPEEGFKSGAKLLSPSTWLLGTKLFSGRVRND